jgi:hypothetical protein
MAYGWLEALQAEDLELKVAGNHFQAVQTTDEESRQNVRFMGAFGSDGPIVRTVRRADEGSTVSFSAILLKPGQPQPGEQDERDMLTWKNFIVAIKRGAQGRDQDWHIYENCAWNSVRVASTLDQVTLTADFSVPGYQPPVRTA